MRWITFSILLYVAAALQRVQLFALARGDHPQIEYLALLAIFYALHAPDDAAPFCGFWCGVALDLISDGQPFGTNAVPLALVAFAVVKVRLSIFRENPVSQFIVAGAGVLLFAVLSGMLRAVVAPSDFSRLGTFWKVCYPLAVNAVYSGIVAPLLFWAMLRMRPLLGFEAVRSRKR